MSNGISLDAPCLGEREKDFLCRAIDSGFVSTIGPFVDQFETGIASFLRSPGAVSVQSGTAALHVALHALGIGPGDEVIVPALTFIATVNPVRYVGATPVFVDVDRDSWTIDTTAIVRAITPRTRAIIPVHLYGNPCDMAAIMAIARTHGLFVVEDATESLGATFDSRQTGTFGDFGCFSFNGNKTITTGGGGMVAGSSPLQLERVRFLVNQARDDAKGYYHPEIGFNYRMTNIEAALGLAQIGQLDDFLLRRQQFNRQYRDQLASVPAVRFQEEPLNGASSCWLTCATLPEDKDIAVVQSALKESGVPTRRVFLPLTKQPPYLEFVRHGCPVAEKIYQHGICLPSSALNGPEEIDRVCHALMNYLS